MTGSVKNLIFHDKIMPFSRTTLRPVIKSLDAQVLVESEGSTPLIPKSAIVHNPALQPISIKFIVI